MPVQARGRGVEAFKLNTLRRVLRPRYVQGHFNAAFRIPLHLVRVHPAQVAQVGQDGQKGLSLSEQKARRGAGQGDISDIMIQCSPPSTIGVHLETFILHHLCNPDVRDAFASERLS